MDMLRMLTVMRYSSCTAAIFADLDVVWAMSSGLMMSTEAHWMASRRSAIASLSSEEEVMAIENVMDDEVME